MMYGGVSKHGRGVVTWCVVVVVVVVVDGRDGGDGTIDGIDDDGVVEGNLRCGCLS